MQCSTARVSCPRDFEYELVFDRMRAANEVFPASGGFRVRPFDFLGAPDDLGYHGLGSWVDPETHKQANLFWLVSRFRFSKPTCSQSRRSGK